MEYVIIFRKDARVCAYMYVFLNCSPLPFLAECVCVCISLPVDVFVGYVEGYLVADGGKVLW